MIVRSPITYRHGQTELEGILVRDDTFEGLRPGVLLIHEFTGPGEYMTPHADRLAREGYVALIGDMYGKEIRPRP